MTEGDCIHWGEQYVAVAGEDGKPIKKLELGCKLPSGGTRGRDRCLTLKKGECPHGLAQPFYPELMEKHSRKREAELMERIAEAIENLQNFLMQRK